MASYKMMKFIKEHPELSPEQIEEERQRRIHHVTNTQQEYNKLHHYDDSIYKNQQELF